MVAVAGEGAVEEEVVVEVVVEGAAAVVVAAAAVDAQGTAEVVEVAQEPGE